MILSIWMSKVIIHLNKEMSDMAEELEESNNNIKISEESNLAFRISTEEKLRKTRDSAWQILLNEKEEEKEVVRKMSVPTPEAQQ